MAIPFLTIRRCILTNHMMHSLSETDRRATVQVDVECKHTASTIQTCILDNLIQVPQCQPSHHRIYLLLDISSLGRGQLWRDVIRDKLPKLAPSRGNSAVP